MKKKTGIQILAFIAGIVIFVGVILLLSGNQITITNCIVTEKGTLYMVYHERPVRLNYGKETAYQTGDKLFIVHSTAFAESDPEQTRTIFLLKIASGSEDDVSSKALSVLEELDKIEIKTQIPALQDMKYADAELVKELLNGKSASMLYEVWGNPTDFFSGMYGAYWEIDEESMVCIYYDFDNVGSDTIVDVQVYHEQESDVKVFLDGENRTDKPIVAAYSNDYAGISLELPEHWEFEIVEEDSERFCIDFWPCGYFEGKLSVKYYGDSFGVCGTGLKEKKIRIGSYAAWQGIYDNRTMWDFISFIGTPGDYVVINEGAEAWWNIYGVEAMQILSTLVIAEDVIHEDEAIEIAEAKATVEYDVTKASFDIRTGIWTVTLYKENIAGGDQTIKIYADGTIMNISWGE